MSACSAVGTAVSLEELATAEASQPMRDERTFFLFFAAGLSSCPCSWHGLGLGGCKNPCLTKNASTTDATKADAASQFYRHSSSRGTPRTDRRTCRCTAALAGSRQLSTWRGGTVRFRTYTGFFSDFRGERRAPNQCWGSIILMREIRCGEILPDRGWLVSPSSS